MRVYYFTEARVYTVHLTTLITIFAVVLILLIFPLFTTNNAAKLRLKRADVSGQTGVPRMPRSFAPIVIDAPSSSSFVFSLTDFNRRRNMAGGNNSGGNGGGGFSPSGAGGAAAGGNMNRMSGGRYPPDRQMRRGQRLVGVK